MNSGAVIHLQKQKKRFSDAQTFVERLDWNYRQNITDGYHSFKELYEHRFRLWILTCRLLAAMQKEADPLTRIMVWCSKLHSDGAGMDGWFLLGIGEEKGKQMTYHFPDRYWEEVCEFAEIRDFAPDFDGHSAKDVLQRLKNFEITK